MTCALVTLGLFTARSFGSDRAVEITWREPIIVAEGRGVRGEWRQNESNYSVIGASFPAIATAAAGSIHICWELLRSSRKHPCGLGYAHSADAGASFTRAIVVPASADPGAA